MVSAGIGFAGVIANGFAPKTLGQPVATPGAGAIEIDLGKSVGRLPHVWEACAGSDRTAVGLRDQWRQDLIRASQEVGIRSVRSHGLFDDEMGIAEDGASFFNFLYVDQIYDYMLDHGVRPFVELSFMPEAFASSRNRIFSYKGNTSPPQRWQDWYDMIYAFTDHCVKRYGTAEVLGWKFEVWNEPNLIFWAGTQEDYFELYRQSALAIKAVDKKLQVGGPSTARLDWIPEFIRYCSSKSLPVNFISTHVYPGDPQKRLFGRDNAYAFEDVIPRGLEMVKNQIESSAMPHLPLYITEWSSQNPAFIAHTLRNTAGLTGMMSYWTFSNVFERLGIPKSPFNNSYGMLDQFGIARPSFHTFSLIHKLGEERLRTGDGSVLATRRSDGSLAILLWNLVPTTSSRAVANGNPLASSSGDTNAGGEPKTVVLKLTGLRGRKQIHVSQVNEKVGSAIPAWKGMGSPKSPTQDQIKELRMAAELPPPRVQNLGGMDPIEFAIELPPNGVALLEFEK